MTLDEQLEELNKMANGNLVKNMQSNLTTLSNILNSAMKEQGISPDDVMKAKAAQEHIVKANEMIKNFKND